MLDNNIGMSNVLNGLESALKIEYPADMRVENVIDSAIRALESSYACTFTKSIWDLQSETQLTSNDLNMLVRNINTALSQLSLFIQLKLYHKNIPFTLSDVNYLGYAKQQLMTALSYLQDEREAATRRKEIIQPLTDTLNSISMCVIKRLFCIMFVLDRLGVYEGVAIIAQFLYMGGLVA